MKQSANTTAANPPATRPAVMFLRAVSRSTGGFLSVRAVRGSPRAVQTLHQGEGPGPAGESPGRDAPLSPRPWAGCGRGESGGYERRGGTVTEEGSVTETPGTPRFLPDLPLVKDLRV